MFFSLERWDGSPLLPKKRIFLVTIFMVTKAKEFITKENYHYQNCDKNFNHNKLHILWLNITNDMF